MFGNVWKCFLSVAFLTFDIFNFILKVKSENKTMRLQSYPERPGIDLQLIRRIYNSHLSLKYVTAFKVNLQIWQTKFWKWRE